MTRFDGDLVELLLAVAEGRLADQGPVQLADRAALTVVMAANGYPGTPERAARSAASTPRRPTAHGFSTLARHCGTAR